MSTLAEAVVQAVNTWPAVALAVVGVAGGWGTLLLKAWTEGRKNSATGAAVKEIKEQVTNGGSNLAASVGEIKRDIKHMSWRIGAMNERVGYMSEALKGTHARLTALESKLD